MLAGVQAFSARLRRVTLRGCKLDSVNFRDVQAHRRDSSRTACCATPTSAAAKLTRVRFPGSTLSDADFTKVTCTDVDLRGATLGSATAPPGIRAGYDSLRGARIDTLQLMTLAPLLAHHLGITVDGRLAGGAGSHGAAAKASARSR